jgi:CDP-diacylglycerol--glycerol-3-phosphate 3-phosphatidyltransferase
MQHPPSPVWTVPNLLSLGRLILAVVFFGAVERGSWPAALGLFAVAASTDWVDGWWARRYGQVTRLGRIFDPLVDKLLVCGGFILLADRGDTAAIRPWMAVVVVMRELVVTAVRAELERSGRDFSAVFSGKLKMVLQCAAILLELGARAFPTAAPAGLPLRPLAAAATLAAVAATVWSGVEYLVAARGLLTEPEHPRGG